MLADLVESLFAPTTILWLLASIAAATVLIGMTHRRRGILTDSLKAFVDRHPSKSTKAKPDDDRDDD